MDLPDVRKPGFLRTSFRVSAMTARNADIPAPRCDSGSAAPAELTGSLARAAGPEPLEEIRDAHDRPRTA